MYTSSQSDPDEWSDLQLNLSCELCGLHMAVCTCEPVYDFWLDEEERHELWREVE